MTDREKVKERVRNAFANAAWHHALDPCEYVAEMLADELTFAKDINVPSKWIPVTEETPEESTDVLLRIKSQTTGTTAVTVGYCYTYYWCHQPMGLRWFERWRASYEPAGGVLDDSWDVTHWMKLPKEPKEDANG